MAYLFDTNAISELLRPRPNGALVEKVAGIPRDEQFTTTIVAAELVAGAHRSTKPDAWVARLRQEVFPRLTILSFDMESAFEYGALKADLLNRGEPIGDLDTMIAAGARRYGLTLVTANTKHFLRIPDLELLTFKPGEHGGVLRDSTKQKD